MLQSVFCLPFAVGPCLLPTLAVISVGSLPALFPIVGHLLPWRDTEIMIHLFEPAVYASCLFSMVIQDLLWLLTADECLCLLRNISVQSLTVHQECILCLYPVLFQPAHWTVFTVIYITHRTAVPPSCLHGHRHRAPFSLSYSFRIERKCTGRSCVLTASLYCRQICITKSDCIYAKNISARSITHIFFTKKTLKVPLCEKQMP